MAYVAIASDLNGHVFSIDENGNLLRNQQGPAGPMIYPGLGMPIGTGWDNVWCLAATRSSGRLLLAGVVSDSGQPDDGRLVSAQTPDEFIDTWNKVTPQDTGQTWPGLDSIMGGLDGVVYAVDSGGNLRAKLFTLMPDGSLQPNSGDAVLASGWSLEVTPFTNGVRFFDVGNAGLLRYYSATASGSDLPNGQWVDLAPAWTRFQNFFGAGPLAIYTISSEGVLALQQFSDDGTVVRLQGAGEVLGSGLAGWSGLLANIEGYCWPQVQQAGGSITFKVAGRLTSPAVKTPSRYSVDFRRLRRMRQGVEANYDQIVAPGPQNLSAAPGFLKDDWLDNGAQWPDAFNVTIGAQWKSGIYAARCTDEQQQSFYIPFVVRPRAKSSAFAVIANTNTWCAYNNWGGKGKYVHSHPIPGVLPFDRPHPGLTPDVFNHDVPCEITNESHHLLRAELWILGWLEDLGPAYACDMFTDWDLHAGIPGIGDGSADRYQGLILTTHPEYWTLDEYDHLKRYQEQGGSIVYLGGNVGYEQVVLKDRSMLIFPGLDRSKFPDDATNEQIRVPCLLRNCCDRPERALIGVGFENTAGLSVNGQPYILQQDPGTNPALAGLTLSKGAAMGSTSADPGHEADGWEVDVRGPGTPPQANAPEALLAARGDGLTGHMLFYETGHGGVVFAGSSLDLGGSLAVDANLQRIVQNALDQCLKH